MTKTYFYKKNDLTSKAIGILGMDLDEVNSMVFENLEGESLTQEQLREKYIQDNHFKSYTMSDYLLSNNFYEYPKISDGEIVGKTDEERKIEGSLKLADNEIIENGVLLVLTDDQMKIRGLKDLEDGEYIDTTGLSDVLVKVPIPQDTIFIQLVWDKETHEWKEGATVEEVSQYYYDAITPIMNEVLLIGYRWTDSKTHIQRVDNNIELTLSQRIETIADEEQFALPTEITIVKTWQFDDFGKDVVLYNQEEFRLLRKEGAEFKEACMLIRGLFIQQKHIPTKEEFAMYLAQPIPQLNYSGYTDSQLYYKLTNIEG